MKYLMLVCWDAENMDGQTEPDPIDTPDEESFPWLDDLQARGIWVTGDQLARHAEPPSESARGRRSSPTGRSVETKEAVGGFDILECGSLEEAEVEIAAGHPVAQTGTIEVRPLWGS